MDQVEARTLIAPAVAPGGAWADVGAGTGTFTRALAELLGPDGIVHAVDRSRKAVEALQRLRVAGGAPIQVRRADFTRPWAELALPRLDGVLLANALHFTDDPAAVLRQAMSVLRPGGGLLLVEYDRSRGNRWIPYPVPPEGFRALATEVGLAMPREVGRRRSAYGRDMYAAFARRPHRE